MMITINIKMLIMVVVVVMLVVIYNNKIQKFRVKAILGFL